MFSTGQLVKVDDIGMAIVMGVDSSGNAYDCLSANPAENAEFSCLGFDISRPTFSDLMAHYANKAIDGRLIQHHIACKDQDLTDLVCFLPLTERADSMGTDDFWIEIRLQLMNGKLHYLAQYGDELGREHAPVTTGDLNKAYQATLAMTYSLKDIATSNHITMPDFA